MLDGKPSTDPAHAARERDISRWLQERPRSDFVYRCAACGTKWTRPLPGSKIPAVWTAAWNAMPAKICSMSRARSRHMPGWSPKALASCLAIAFTDARTALRDGCDH